MALLRIKVIKAEQMNIAGLRRELLKQVKAEGQEIIKLMNQTTQSWTGAKPTFEDIGTISGQEAFTKVVPRGSKEGIKKWNILDLGAKRHIIKARSRKTLAFRQGGFKAKTSPGRVRSRGGSPATGPRRFPKAVNHPGIKKRGWTPLITKKRQKPFQRNMQRANNLAVNRLY